MKNILILLLLSFFNCYSQNNVFDELGFRNFSYTINEETMTVLIKSKEGEENIKKPLILYIQGSMGRPLLINYPSKNYRRSIAFPFDVNQLTANYHIAVISKPFIPYLVNIENLDANFCYIDSITKKNPIDFLKNDNLKYISHRNEKLIKHLKKLSFIDKNKIILLGHSEGSRIAFEIAKKSHNKISNLIYLSGNPFGRYMNQISRDRKEETEKDLLKKETVFDYWNTVLKNKNNKNYQSGGDSYNSTYIYSQPYSKAFLKLKKPVFIGYGTRDDCSIFNDLLRFYALNENKNNFHFQSYIGLDHSFYPVNDNGETNHENPKINNVIDDVLTWLQTL